MTRPTDSRIIYLQQLGRALSSDTSREKTIVFDLVNNYIRNNLDAEVNNRTKGTPRGNGGIVGIGGIDGGSEPEDIDIFRIQGETLEFLKILEEIQGIADISVYLINARAIKEWIEKSGDTRPPAESSKDEEERKLGQALHTIRQQLIKPYMELKTEEEREEFRSKHPEADEVLEIITEIDTQYGNKKQKELAILIRQDLEKRKILQEAKELESSYMTQLSKVEVLDVENNTIETNLDEQ